MNNFRENTPALQSPLSQKQEAQMIDACGVSKKYSNKRGKYVIRR